MDAQAVFGLSRKDLQRQTTQVHLSDLSARQLALALCQMSQSLCPLDLMEIGGELAIGLQINQTVSAT